MPKLADVATLAGVSPATVSRALSGNGHVSKAARARVVQAAHDLDYVVSSNASGLASGRSKNIAVVVPFLDRWYFGSVLEGAESALLAHGYDLTLYNLHAAGVERDNVFAHFLLRKRVDAVLAIALELRPAEIARLLQLGKPIVGVGGPLPGVQTLSIDDVAVGRLATEHLIALGHRAIAHIGADAATETDFHVPTNRRRGYEEALAANGIPSDPALFAPADFTIPGGCAAAKSLLGSPGARPTAIFASSDEMAIGAILAARDLGLRVPDDVSVIGADDHSLAGFFGLSTVAQSPVEQGRAAVEILMRQLAVRRASPEASGEREPEGWVVAEHRLVVRSSTARPASARG